MSQSVDPSTDCSGFSNVLLFQLTHVCPPCSSSPGRSVRGGVDSLCCRWLVRATRSCHQGDPWPKTACYILQSFETDLKRQGGLSLCPPPPPLLHWCCRPHGPRLHLEAFESLLAYTVVSYSKTSLLPIMLLLYCILGLMVDAASTRRMVLRRRRSIKCASQAG